MISGFPVFVNQPFFRELKQFLITDMGSHLLDVARFLFGEADSLYCQTRRVHADIAGEDVATIMMSMGGVTVLCEMAYAENHLDPEPFPQTLMFIEGNRGSIRLDYDYRVSVTTASGTQSRRIPPPRYAWADPAYDVVQSSMVPCLENLLAGLRGGSAETTGEDNLQTVRLVFAAYDSAAPQRCRYLCENCLTGSGSGGYNRGMSETLPVASAPRKRARLTRQKSLHDEDSRCRVHTTRSLSAFPATWLASSVSSRKRKIMPIWDLILMRRTSPRNFSQQCRPRAESILIYLA